MSNKTTMILSKPGQRQNGIINSSAGGNASSKEDLQCGLTILGYDLTTDIPCGLTVVPCRDLPASMEVNRNGDTSIKGTLKVAPHGYADMPCSLKIANNEMYVYIT